MATVPGSSYVSPTGTTTVAPVYTAQQVAAADAASVATFGIGATTVSEMRSNGVQVVTEVVSPANARAVGAGKVVPAKLFVVSNQAVPAKNGKVAVTLGKNDGAMIATGVSPLEVGSPSDGATLVVVNGSNGGNYVTVGGAGNGTSSNPTATVNANLKAGDDNLNIQSLGYVTINANLGPGANKMEVGGVVSSGALNLKTQKGGIVITSFNRKDTLKIDDRNGDGKVDNTDYSVNQVKGGTQVILNAVAGKTGEASVFLKGISIKKVDDHADGTITLY